jgi:tRNA modification GTPase
VSTLIAEDDTIAAIATPMGKGGIGIVRVSGPLAVSIFRSVFRPGKPIEVVDSHRLYYGWASDPDRDRRIDEVFAALMLAPNSYTREDVLEIQCHSGPAVLRRILDLVIRQGARLAEPGEFTRRALLNGRIDLTQAEAVLELTDAQSELQREWALSQLEGGLKKRTESTRSSVLDALARVEVEIDFPEEDGVTLEPRLLSAMVVREVLTPLKDLIDAYSCGRILREGARLVVIGKPNVGKSSLFNSLLGTGRVIVSPLPGTTRDIIEESLELAGLKVTIVDTAGIHDGGCDPIEDQGIRLAHRQIVEADHLLAVFDLSSRLTDEDFAVLRSTPMDKSVTLVLNKRDLCPAWKDTVRACADELRPHIDHRRLTGEKSCHAKTVAVSALTGEGLRELKSVILKELLSRAGPNEMDLPLFIPNLRQKTAMEKAVSAIEKAVRGLDGHLPPELVASDLREGLEKINEILGIETGEDILDRIFASFCLGK